MTTVAGDLQTTSTALQPVQPNERIAVLDVLRGFALLGICVINVPGFFTPVFFKAAGESLYPAWYDHATLWVVNFLGSGKFNSMFSFLFGVGFAIQLDRAAARGHSFVGTYLRRLLALFAFGVAHCLLIWNGDVLHVYAILGLPLLLFRKLGDRWLWTIAALTLIAPIVSGAVDLYREKPDPHPQSYWRERAENQLRVYGRGSYDDLLARFTKSAPEPPRSVVGRGSCVDAVKERCRETYEDYAENGGAWFWAVMATTLTIGYIVGRRRVFQDLEAQIPRIRRLAWWTGGVGLILAAAFATFALLQDTTAHTPTLLGMLSELFYVLNRPILCACYVCVIILLARQPSWRWATDPLANVGRMPLTNYLMQSVIHSAIFYGYGFGLYGRVGPAVGTLIALGTFALQVVYSNLWMSRFRFGPMEWLWRVLTYGKPPLAPVGQ